MLGVGDRSDRKVLAHDDSMRLPIHLACDKNAPFSIIMSLLDADAGEVSIGVLDKWGIESPPPSRGGIVGARIAGVDARALNKIQSFAQIGIVSPAPPRGAVPDRSRPAPPHGLQQAPDRGGEW